MHENTSDDDDQTCDADDDETFLPDEAIAALNEIDLIVQGDYFVLSTLVDIQEFVEEFAVYVQ